jgi:hypothetical protein
MKIQMKIENGQQEEMQKILDVFFEDVKNDDEFDEKMDQFEDMCTPKYEILQKCREDFRSVLDAYIVGTLSKEKALLLLESKNHHWRVEIRELALRGDFIIIDDVPEEFMNIAWFINRYYNGIKYDIEHVDTEGLDRETPIQKSFSASMDKYFGVDKTKNNASGNGNLAKQPEKEIPQPENNTPLPPIIQRVLSEGLLKDTPVNNKYIKRDGVKDTKIIKWMIDYSGYEDTLTPELYMQYIQTNVLPQTIGQYISRATSEAK